MEPNSSGLHYFTCNLLAVNRYPRVECDFMTIPPKGKFSTETGINRITNGKTIRPKSLLNNVITLTEMDY